MVAASVGIWQFFVVCAFASAFSRVTNVMFDTYISRGTLFLKDMLLTPLIITAMAWSRPQVGKSLKGRTPTSNVLGTSVFFKSAVMISLTSLVCYLALLYLTN